MFRIASSIVLVTLLAAGQLSAQHPNTRQGFWIGLGAGFGSVGTDCPACSTDRTNGGAAYIRLGGTLSPMFQLGGESDGWFRSSGGVDEALAFASFIANIYPSRTGAFFLKVGFGGMSYRADDGIAALTAEAPSGTLGAGYDIRVKPNFSLTPFINVLATSAVTFKVGGVSVSTQDFKVNLLQVGLGVTWH